MFPSIASGGGAIPITGGAATSGPAVATGGTFGPLSIGGLFGSNASSNGSQMLLHISIGVAVGFVLSRVLKRR